MPEKKIDKLYHEALANQRSAERERNTEVTISSPDWLYGGPENKAEEDAKKPPGGWTKPKNTKPLDTSWRDRVY